MSYFVSLYFKHIEIHYLYIICATRRAYAGISSGRWSNTKCMKEKFILPRYNDNLANVAYSQKQALNEFSSKKCYNRLTSIQNFAENKKNRVNYFDQKQ